MKLSKRVGWVCGLSLLILGCGKTDPQSELVKDHQIAGSVVADMIRDASLPPSGTLVVLEADRGLETSPVISRMINRFEQSIRSTGYQVDRQQILIKGGRKYEDIWSGPTADEVRSAVGRAPSPAVAVISFFGPPRHLPHEMEEIPVFAVCGYEEQAQSAVRSGILRAAVADIRTPGLSPLERNYQIVH